jgi:hypothetical protein
MLRPTKGMSATPLRRRSPVRVSKRRRLRADGATGPHDRVVREKCFWSLAKGGTRDRESALEDQQ